MSEAIQEKDFLETVFSVLVEVNKNKEQQREIDDLLNANHRIPRGVFDELLVNPAKFESLSEEEKAVFVTVFYTVTKNEDTNPSNFYSSREIKNAERYKREVVEQLTLPYTFEGVIAAPSGRDYVTIMSYQEVVKLWLSKILTYNFDTQRLSKKKAKKDGTFLEKIDINQKSVKNIARLMTEGKYKADTLLFNILVDGNDDVEYSNGDLTIGEGTTLNLIDGAHRVTAMIKVLEDNPNFDGFINVAIKHFPLQEAQFLLGQVNTVNRFDKTLIKNYMSETIGAQITKDLMNIPELRNRVSIKTTLDKKILYFTNFAILSESIESIFEPKNTKDRYDFTEALKKFFGYLIPSFESELTTNKSEVAKVSWINHHNMFVGFVVVAKKLYDKYGKDFPVDEIVRIINAIDLSKTEGSEFNTLMAGQGKVNSNRVKRSIRKFFEEKVDALL
ncbi:DNA sulfur modification protein DndB [Paenibacillus xylaniclasticus]|uniref:DNA sulfur modification protein DndB n=1 Tax=Paenibacillus xylaniclasticus TaxID=588083 RepID=UPI000FDA8395|nr:MULTISPECIES: DNA sulfur modification protein DndB [Paenibacillus]GFN32509.1 hypothetical protein PCURB6_27690 [Paenibacillus curdlanolyticus]